jgi:hypothetical protein
MDESDTYKSISAFSNSSKVFSEMGLALTFGSEFASSSEYIHGLAVLDMGCQATINTTRTQIGDKIV